MEMAFSDDVSRASLALLHSLHGMKSDSDDQPSCQCQVSRSSKDGHKSRKDHVPSLLRLDTVDSDDGQWKGFSVRKEGDGTERKTGCIAVDEESDKGNVYNPAAELQLVSHSRTCTIRPLQY